MTRIRLIAVSLIAAIVLLFVAPSAVADTYIVAVGINRYKNMPMLHVSEADAKDFAALCKHYPGAHVTLITGRYATTARLRKAIARRYAGTKADDMLIFYFSGHGAEDGCATFDASGPGNLLSFADIARAMKRSPAKRKIIIADSCHSGASRSQSSGSRQHSSNDPDVLLFMSSRANENSQEVRGGKNSLFTHYLLRGLKGRADADSNRRITAVELFNYVSPAVAKASGNMQHPVMWGNFDRNMVLFKY